MNAPLHPQTHALLLLWPEHETWTRNTTQQFGFVCPPGAFLALGNLTLAFAIIPGEWNQGPAAQTKHQVIVYLWQTTVVASKSGPRDTNNLTSLLLFHAWPQGVAPYRLTSSQLPLNNKSCISFNWLNWEELHTVNLAFGWCWQSRWHWCLELESISWPRLIIHKALWWLPQSVQTGAAERKAYTNLSKTELKQLGTYKKLWMKIWNLESKTMSLRAVSTLWVILCSSRTRLYMMKWRIWLSRVTHAWLIGEWWIALNNSTLHILTTKSRHRLEICNNSNCDFNQ